LVLILWLGGSNRVVLRYGTGRASDGAPPIEPADRADQKGRSSESPSDGGSNAAGFQTVMTRAEFLTQAHFDSGRCIRGSRVGRKRAELRAGFEPGVLQRSASRARPRMLGGSKTLLRRKAWIAIGVQTQGFEFFAVHRSTSKLHIPISARH